MCKSKSAAMVSTPKPLSRSIRSLNTNNTASSSSTNILTANSKASTTSSSSSAASLAALRESLPEDHLPALFLFSEIKSATSEFAESSRLPSSSCGYSCRLRGHDAAVFRRRLRCSRFSDPALLASRLSALGRSHHSSLARLLGAAVTPTGDHIYLAYQLIPSASSLTDVLRNKRNPSFTPLPTWLSRLQVAADLAAGLEYIHEQAGTVHNRLKSDSIVVTASGRAKICHFAAADLAGELPETGHDNNGSPTLRRSSSRGRRIEGTRGYMAPETITGGGPTRQSDVYAFGMVLLEIISGEEPVKYRQDRERKGVVERVSLIETATAAAEAGNSNAMRQWVDRRLKDSFPVEAAERLTAVALQCVAPDPAMRPQMESVAAKVSALYIESQKWHETIRVPTDFFGFHCSPGTFRCRDCS